MEDKFTMSVCEATVSIRVNSKALCHKRAFGLVLGSLDMLKVLNISYTKIFRVGK